MVLSKPLSAQGLRSIRAEFSDQLTAPTIYTLDFEEQTLVINGEWFPDLKAKIPNRPQQSDAATGKPVADSFAVDTETQTRLIEQLLTLLPDSNVNLKGRSVFRLNLVKLFFMDEAGDTLTVFAVNPMPGEHDEVVELLTALFEFFYKIIDTDPALALTEATHRSFYFGIPFRQIGTEPLEYRMWGNLYGCRLPTMDLDAFFEALPTDQPIVIDGINAQFEPCILNYLMDYGISRKIYVYGFQTLLNQKQQLATILEDPERRARLSEEKITKMQTLYARVFETRQEVLQAIHP